MSRWKSIRGLEGVVLDTMVWIYLFEDHPDYGKACDELVNLCRNHYFGGVITAVTMAEVLVKPYRAGRQDIAESYRSALTATPGLVYDPIQPTTAAMAAALRAKYGKPLPDMLQCAAALKYERPVLVTNDAALKGVDELRVVLIDDVM